VAKLKFTTTDGVLVGIAGVILTIFFFVDQESAKQKNAQPPGAHTAASPNAGRVNRKSSGGASA
jgi:hypothetical protein